MHALSLPVRPRAVRWIAALALVAAATILVAPNPLAAQIVAPVGWQPGLDASPNDNTLDGYLDMPSATASVPAGAVIRASGWVIDRSAIGWAGIDDVQIWSGKMNAGGTLLARPLFAQARPDVGKALNNAFWANSGFAVDIAPNTFAPGLQSIAVYARTPGKGWWFKEVLFTVVPGSGSAVVPTTANGTPGAGNVKDPNAAPPIISISEPNATTRLSVRSGQFTVKGYAFDPAAKVLGGGVGGSGVDRVEVYMDEERGNNGRFIGNAELGNSSPDAGELYGSAFGASGFRISFNQTDFNPANHHIYAYARSASSGKESSAIAGFVMFDPNLP